MSYIKTQRTTPRRQSNNDVEWSHFKAVPNPTPCSAPGRLTQKNDDQYA